MSEEQTKDLAEITQLKQQNSDEHVDEAPTSSTSSALSKGLDKNGPAKTISTNRESTSVDIPVQPNETSQQQQQQQQQERDTDQTPEIPIVSGPDLLSDNSQHEASSMQYLIYKWPMRFDPIAIVFAILIFVGGLIGYILKESAPSLVAGTIFALLLAVGIYFEGARKNPYPLLVTLLTLAGLMFWRYSAKWTFLPSGLITLLASLMFARHAYILSNSYNLNHNASHSLN